MRRNTVFAIIAFTLAGILAPSFTQRASAQTTTELYRCFAVSMGTGAGKRATVDIGIYRYSTQEERDHYLQILKTQGSGALNSALANAEQVAFLRVNGSMGYKLRFVREVPDQPAGKKHLLIVADRPITFGESRNATRSQKYNFTIIELFLDHEGRGEGKLAIGVDVKWNAEKQIFEREQYTSEPVRLLNVAPVKLK